MNFFFFFFFGGGGGGEQVSKVKIRIQNKERKNPNIRLTPKITFVTRNPASFLSNRLQGVGKGKLKNE